MGVIQQLPPAVVNQIAAGEVVERPASVVKELLENAVDAGATRIGLEIEDGGRALIRVADNGSGMARQDLPLAVAAHATSKLRSSEDLFHVQTMGFRGEALASIASVSQLRIQTRQPGSVEGWEIEAGGDTIGEVRACGCPEGTSVEVRNLFFNTPVRRRFLRATHTELGHVVESFTRIALAWPRVALRLEHNGKQVYDLPASAQLLERLALFFGKELAAKLIWVESERHGQRLWGYVADPSETRANNRTQYLFVNGRFIRDASLQHALQEAYRGLVMTGRHPVAFLFLELPPESVDVNVHPTKTAVRFQDSNQHYSQLLGTLREKFLRSDLTSRFRLPAAHEATAHDLGATATHALTVAPDIGEGGPALGNGSRAPAGADDAFEAQRERVRQSIADYYERRGPAAAGSTWPGPAAASPPDPARSGEFALRAERSPAATARLPFSRDIPTNVGPVTPLDTIPSPDERPSTTNYRADLAGLPPSPPADHAVTGATAADNAIQIHNSYIVVETADGMMVIDQHALHERVLYEELRTRVLSGQCETQRLLVPETIEATPSEVAAIVEYRDLLDQLGIEAEPFGGGTIVVHAYPAMLANLAVDRLLRDVLDRITGSAAVPNRRDLLDSMLHMIACKAAIKAGQRLTVDEIRALVGQRHLAQDHHHCPHGRPTALVLSKNELERQFKRT